MLRVRNNSGTTLHCFKCTVRSRFSKKCFFSGISRDFLTQVRFLKMGFRRNIVFSLEHLREFLTTGIFDCLKCFLFKFQKKTAWLFRAHFENESSKNGCFIFLYCIGFRNVIQQCPEMAEARPLSPPAFQNGRKTTVTNNYNYILRDGRVRNRRR